MKKLLPIGFCLLLGLSLFTGCGGGGSAISSFGSPPPPSPPVSPTPASSSHLYINNSTLYAYALPITAKSTPVVSISGSAGESGMAFDRTHRLFAAQSYSVQVFTQPIANGSTPAFTLATTGLPGFFDVKVDSAGDVFISGNHLSGRCGPAPRLVEDVDVFMAPVTSPSAANISFAVAGPGCYGAIPSVGIALDGIGNLWVGTTGTMFKYTPPFSNASTPALQFPIGAVDSSDLAFDSAGNMYAATSVGVVVYKPPFTASTVNAFTISPPVFARYLAFDAAGNLYVTTLSNNLLVFSPPFSAASAPVVTLALPTAALAPGGVAIGP